MKVFVTGGAGFIGSHVVRALVDAGHDVTALAHRDPPPSGARAVHGDVARLETYVRELAGHDAAIHLAAIYRLGASRPRDRRAMYRVNVEGTRAFLDAAIATRVPRIVHVSSTAALGETNGVPGTEHTRHGGVFRSYYEQTKHIAHGIALARIARGAPVAIAIPGGIFGEGDRSVLATTLRDLRRGKLPIQVATTSTFQLCHVDRVCDGLVRILERGVLGESYVLAGMTTSMPELIARAAAIADRPVPRAVAPGRLRWIAAAADRVRRLGIDLPLSSEALRVMDGSAYVYCADKARRELGWDPGDVEGDLARYLRTS